MDKNKIMLKRLAAFAFDLILVAAVCVGIYLLFSYLELNSLIGIGLGILVTVGYFTAFAASPIAATPGMAMLGMWIVYEDDKANHFVKALTRFLFGVITCIPFGFGFWYGFLSSDGKTVYDIAVNSSVATYSQRMKGAAVPCLFDVSGPQKALCCEIEKGGAVLGRDQRVCKVVFPADAPGISRIHCNVRYNEQTGVFLLEDMGSSFGTFAENGEQIYPGKIKVLENNQRFYLAQRSNMFCVGFKEDTK